MQIRQSTNTSTLLVSEKFQSTSGITTNTYSTRERERERETRWREKHENEKIFEPRWK
jgi:hypothetical protein